MDVLNIPGFNEGQPNSGADYFFNQESEQLGTEADKNARKIPKGNKNRPFM